MGVNWLLLRIGMGNRSCIFQTPMVAASDGLQITRVLTLARRGRHKVIYLHLSLTGLEPRKFM